MEFNQLLTMAALMAGIIGICTAIGVYLHGKQIKSAFKEPNKKSEKNYNKID